MPIYDPKKRRNKRIVHTKDGTLTLYSAEFDECYHSTKDGALKESLHKHIIPAFRLCNRAKDELAILDICFGLGYNTLTTLYYLNSHPFEGRIRIFSPEFDKELVGSLEDFSYPQAFAPFAGVIKSLARSGYYIDEQIEIRLLFGDARKIIPRLEIEFDIIYQDPFSPKKNPLLWTREYFADLRRIASDDLILTSYSSSTAVRMGLYENGFYLYEHPSNEVRKGTIASLRELELTPIDMELKKERNPAAASLRDRDFMI